MERLTVYIILLEADHLDLPIKLFLRTRKEVCLLTLSTLQNKYPPVLCMKQVAEILVVSHNTAYELIRSGKIHSVRVGRSYRIPLDAVIDYLSKH